MIEIIDGVIVYNGLAWTIIEIAPPCVHLANEDGGVCVEVSDPELLAQLEALAP